MELKQLKDFVEYLLREHPALRGNDDVLYLEVLRKIHPYWNNGRITTNIENMPIGEFFAERKNMKLPTYESVSRCRRKLQEENPALKPSEAIQKGREVQREKFLELAKNYKKLKQQSFEF
jgi:hypothetical protein